MFSSRVLAVASAVAWSAVTAATRAAMVVFRSELSPIATEDADGGDVGAADAGSGENSAEEVEQAAAAAVRLRIG